MIIIKNLSTQFIVLSFYNYTFIDCITEKLIKNELQNLFRIC